MNHIVLLIYFQSTGSTTITTVNALDRVDIYVSPRDSEWGATKRTCTVEMNEGMLQDSTNCLRIPASKAKDRANSTKTKRKRKLTWADVARGSSVQTPVPS
jgi:hypothetical protein